MSLFGGRKRADDYTVIVGCGRLGANLASTLSDQGENVLVIDQDREAFYKLSDSYGGLTIEGDGTDMGVLREAQIEKATAVVTVTNDDNTNIMVSQIAKKCFHIPRVIARLYDPERECVYREFGIDTICPAILSAKEVSRILGGNEKGM